MGTCYSTNTVAVKSASEKRIPKEKHSGSQRKGKLNAKESSHKKSPIKPCEIGYENVDDVISRSSSPDIVSEYSNEKIASSGVVPSDSGIESLDNIPQVAHLLTNTDVSDVKLKHNNTTLTDRSTDGKHITSNCSPIDTNISNINSESCKLNSENNKYIRGSAQSASLNDTSNLLQSQAVDTDSSVSVEKLGNRKSSKTEFGSIEANLNDHSFCFNQKRKSLLSEILDMTQTLCKSDFYPSENFNRRDHEINEAGTQESCDQGRSDIGASGQFDKNNHNLNQISRADYSPVCSCKNSLQTFRSPSKKGASLPKNVSFATHEEGGSDDFTALTSSPLNKPTVKSKIEGPGCLKSNLLESHKTKSELLLSKQSKDIHKRSASLGSVRTLTNDSGSDVPDCGTEDDLASLDLDNISRVTSQSYSSIRQLMESAEDIVSLCSAAQPVTIDGVECIVIPTATYLQMQKDLATLKQQLLYLSSLIQETEEEL